MVDDKSQRISVVETTAFKAESWLSMGKFTTPSPPRKNIKPSKFFPPDFLTPGWSGESLFSKSAMGIKKTMNVLLEDALEQFCALGKTNRSFKMAVYNEFLCFVHSEREKDAHLLENFEDFWNHLFEKQSPCRSLLDEFSALYCHRIISVYLYKIRFMIHLGDALGFSITKNNLSNPSSLIGKLFPKGSSSELFCESLGRNSYSWYRPSSFSKENIEELKSNLISISISEMMRICTFDPGNKRFSHTLSHKSFGRFLHHLLVDLPRWNSYGSEESFINCRFTGNELHAFSLAHYLAMETVHSKDSLICPSFSGEGFAEGHYLRICQEIQFMTSLICSRKDSKKIIPFLCGSMKKKYFSGFEDVHGQMPVFGQNEFKSDQNHNRIVINMSSKYSYNQVVCKINQEKKNLKKKGLLYVLTNQNLFSSGRDQKKTGILKYFHLEGYINMESLKGKGEIPSYIYILTARSEDHPKGPSFYTDHCRKESCFCFKWNGDLSSFQKFSGLSSELARFFLKENSLDIPVYQKNIDSDLFFNFHQDAIIDGNMLSSMSSNTSRITHPSFFNNLVNTCIPLDMFFYIELLGERANNLSKLLGVQFKQEERHPFVLIVDFRNSTDIRLELITSDSYRAKLEKYGDVYFRYVGLTPKCHDINVNIFREFFNSDIGRQIIQLSLGSDQRKLKGKLKSLLIPRFFLDLKTIPEYRVRELDFLRIDSRELLKIHPEEMINRFEKVKHTLDFLEEDYPWQILGLLVQFKHVTSVCLEKFEENRDLVVDFSNPYLMEPLLRLRLSPLYPHNKDVYVEFASDSLEDTRAVIKETKVETREGNHCLKIFSSDGHILSLYSSKGMLAFIQYVMGSAESIPLRRLLRELQIPAQKELDALIYDFNKIKESISLLYTSVDKMISHMMVEKISSNEKKSLERDFNLEF